MAAASSKGADTGGKARSNASRDECRQPQLRHFFVRAARCSVIAAAVIFFPWTSSDVVITAQPFRYTVLARQSLELCSKIKF
jgi:hypothetical protein